MRRHCPACRQPVGERTVNQSFPFCSERCRLADLGKWFDGQYRIPGERAGDGAAGVGGADDEDEGGGGTT